MHRRGFLLSLIQSSLILIPLLLIGCGDPGRATSDAPETQPTEENEPRIVVLAPALGVICQDLGLEDRIVGKHAWDASLGASIPSVGTHDDPDMEAILRADPTHILVQRLASNDSVLAQAAREHGWVIWDFPLLELDDVAVAIDEISLRFFGRPELGYDSGDLQSLDPSAVLGREMPSARLADAWADRGGAARAAGRVLLLASTDPAGAMGPGSFHHQLIERMGATPALMTGGPWQELDHEDLVRLAPDTIILFAPATPPGPGEPARPDPTVDDAMAALGGIASLDIPAIRQGRVLLIDDPLGLMPASSLTRVADRIGEAFERWAAEQSP